MPKKTKSFKKNTNDEKVVRKLEHKDDDTNYGIVTRVLGNGHFKVKLNLENREVLGVLRGKFRKGSNKKDNFVQQNTVVLVSIRDFEQDKVDIVYVYKENEVRQLKKSGEFVEENTGGDDGSIEEDNAFDFEEI
jgi:initiation factor 1A